MAHPVLGFRQFTCGSQRQHDEAEPSAAHSCRLWRDEYRALEPAAGVTLLPASDLLRAMDLLEFGELLRWLDVLQSPRQQGPFIVGGLWPHRHVCTTAAQHHRLCICWQWPICNQIDAAGSGAAHSTTNRTVAMSRVPLHD